MIPSDQLSGSVELQDRTRAEHTFHQDNRNQTVSSALAPKECSPHILTLSAGQTVSTVSTQCSTHSDSALTEESRPAAVPSTSTHLGSGDGVVETATKRVLSSTLGTKGTTEHLSFSTKDNEHQTNEKSTDLESASNIERTSNSPRSASAHSACGKPCSPEPESSLDSVSESAHAMLRNLAHVIPSAEVQSQQRGEPDLTESDKLKRLCEVFRGSQARFLRRFHGYLRSEDMGCFSASHREPEVQYYLAEARERLDTKKQELAVKNRRYKAMESLTEAGTYFSTAEMKAREPNLYEQMIGQYQTEEEALEQSQAEWSNPDLRFSHVLLDQFDHMNTAHRRALQRAQESNEEDVESEGDDSDGEQRHADEVVKDTADSNEESTAEGPTISASEKERLKKEFLTVMQQRFLSGLDADFDYSSVDTADGTQADRLQIQDAEDRYFDDEEPNELIVTRDACSRGNTDSTDSLDYMEYEIKAVTNKEDVTPAVEKAVTPTVNVDSSKDAR